MKSFVLVFLGVLVLTIIGISLRNSQTINSSASGAQVVEVALIPPTAKPHFVPNGQFELWDVFPLGGKPAQWDKPYVVGTENVPGAGYNGGISLRIIMPACPMKNGVPVCKARREYSNKSRNFSLSEIGLVAGKPTWLSYESIINQANVMTGQVSFFECNSSVCAPLCVTNVPTTPVESWTSRTKRCQTPSAKAGNFYQITVNTDANDGNGKTKDVMRIDNIRLSQ